MKLVEGPLKAFLKAFNVLLKLVEGLLKAPLKELLGGLVLGGRSWGVAPEGLVNLQKPPASLKGP